MSRLLRVEPDEAVRRAEAELVYPQLELLAERRVRDVEHDRALLVRVGLDVGQEEGLLAAVAALHRQGNRAVVVGRVLRSTVVGDLEGSVGERLRLPLR